MGLLGELRAPYGALEAWVYDRFLAPAALDMVHRSGCHPWRELSAGARLMDVGCGGGHLLMEVAAERPDLALLGVDLAAGQVRRGQARARMQGRAAAWCAGSALELPVADGAVDGVVSVGSIKHWPDRRQGLRECLRVLKPGGFLLVVEFDRASPDAEVACFLDRWHPPAPVRARLVPRFRRRIMEDALDLAGVPALLAELPVTGVRAAHVPGAPALAVEGRRA